MPKSDKKQSATTHSKTQAFNHEALQLLLVASNAQTAAETTASLNDLGKKLATLETNVGATDKKVSKIMKKIDINQAIQDDCQESTTKSIANLQTTLDSQPVQLLPTIFATTSMNFETRFVMVVSSMSKKFFVTTISKPSSTSSSKHPIRHTQHTHQVSRAFQHPTEKSVAQYQQT
eukprot:scaffold152510_cov29-Attheya_sp.AAC.1